MITIRTIRFVASPDASHPRKGDGRRRWPPRLHRHYEGADTCGRTIGIKPGPYAMVDRYGRPSPRRFMWSSAPA